MAIKRLEHLEEPIDEPQGDPEKPRHYYFLNLYFDTDIGLYKFIKSFDGLKKGMKWVCSGYDGEVTLQYHPPSQGTLQNWATSLRWNERKTAHWNYFFARGKEKRAKIVEAYVDSFLRDVIESVEGLKNTEEAIDDDFETKAHLLAKGKSDIANAKGTYWTIMKEIGGISDPPSQVEFSGEVDSHTEIQTDLQRDIEEYQKKLLDGSLAERTRNRFRKKEA